jgi:N-methylhydantoinase A/oxoprolinase/acetone carboxylase beta subunit
MERAIRVVSVERGHDPRRFALLAFGGAGGMHACEIARRLEIGTVLVPRHAGVLSALGMLMADVRRDYSASVLRPAAAMTPRDLEARLKPLVDQARRELAGEGFAPARQAIERLVDVRYVGQSYEITVSFGPDVRAKFDRQHQQLYGYSDPKRPAEIVNVRVNAAGVTEKPVLPLERVRRGHRPKPETHRRGRFDGRAVSIACYRWPDLAPGARARGPAVITSGEASVVIPPDFRFEVDGFRNIVARSPSAKATGDKA